MPRRSLLSAADRDSLLALPDNRDTLIWRYTLRLSDIAVIRQRRGAANRLGFAVQLSYLRYPGVVLGVDQLPSPPLLHFMAGQLRIPVEHWAEYAIVLRPGDSTSLGCKQSSASCFSRLVITSLPSRN